MTILLTLHLLAIGIWIGVVGAELLIEFDGMKDDQSHIRAAKLHYGTDIWVEVPAFVTVFITGFMMLSEEHLRGLFLAKIIFGLLAIGFNAVCVYGVVRRRNYALSGDLKGMKSVAPLLRLTAAFLPTFAIAFVLGVYFAAQ
jgi:hypothetical protein